MSITLSVDEIEDIINVLESTASMMEPYYSQCNGQDDAWKMIEFLQNKLPYTHVVTVVEPAYCKICNQTFEKSSKGKKLDQAAQDTAVANHLISVHGIQDYKERRKLRQRCQVKTVRVEYKTKAEFLASEK